jgi:hypothetical protein
MIRIMGKFTAIGMHTVTPPAALVIGTCSDNDTASMGSATLWSWSNPTNRAIWHSYADVDAVSVECLWQGTKIFQAGGRPDPETLRGDWRRGKARRPIGAWAGEGRPLITDPGEARRAIYLPAFRSLIERWMRNLSIAEWIAAARAHAGPVFLRDFDTGRGVDRDGPMSHAWVLASWLNTGKWPEREAAQGSLFSGRSS